MTREEAIEVLKNNDEYDRRYIGEVKDESQEAIDMAIKALEQEPILNKIKAEIEDCLKALDNIEKSGFNIYLPNEISGRRLTYQQCLEFIDKYKAESEDKE